MNLKLVEYRKELFTSAVEIMSDTWDFNSMVPGLKKKNLLNELFFQSAIISMEYSQVIVDENNNVLGYLFGTIPGGLKHPLKNAFRTIGLAARVIANGIAGNFGTDNKLLSMLKNFNSIEEQLKSRKQENDAYVGLFFVSSKLRGQGWGKRLMKDFEDRAMEQGSQRVYLWTDLGCNYGYYDNNGFVRQVEVSTPLLSKYDGGVNGFSYAKRLSA